jgi:hypothetical protein
MEIADFGLRISDWSEADRTHAASGFLIRDPQSEIRY